MVNKKENVLSVTLTKHVCMGYSKVIVHHAQGRNVHTRVTNSSVSNAHHIYIVNINYPKLDASNVKEVFFASMKRGKIDVQFVVRIFSANTKKRSLCVNLVVGYPYVNMENDIGNVWNVMEHVFANTRERGRLVRIVKDLQSANTVISVILAPSVRPTNVKDVAISLYLKRMKMGNAYVLFVTRTPKESRSMMKTEQR